MDSHEEPRSASRLLDQLRARIRVLHYGIRTEDHYVQWIKRYIEWLGKVTTAKSPARVARARSEGREGSSDHAPSMVERTAHVSPPDQGQVRSPSSA
ncbi:MAG: phage integrase N-terminal SAM-like domain-containing protein [Burkholderiales bacterium]